MFSNTNEPFGSSEHVDQQFATGTIHAHIGDHAAEDHRSMREHTYTFTGDTIDRRSGQREHSFWIGFILFYFRNFIISTVVSWSHM